MPISIDTIRQAAARGNTFAKAATSVTAAKALGMQTAFLCHSHKDADLVQGVITLLRETGWNVYVDWADKSMPDTPDRETAARIKQRIVDTNFFLFLATANSTNSKWCPWEIGYADGKKSIEKILILPTTDRSGTWHGNEYLQLYRRIDEAHGGGLAAWEPGQKQNGVWIRTL